MLEIKRECVYTPAVPVIGLPRSDAGEAQARRDKQCVCRDWKVESSTWHGWSRFRCRWCRPRSADPCPEQELPRRKWLADGTQTCAPGTTPLLPSGGPQSSWWPPAARDPEDIGAQRPGPHPELVVVLVDHGFWRAAILSTIND